MISLLFLGQKLRKGKCLQFYCNQPYLIIVCFTTGSCYEKYNSMQFSLFQNAPSIPFYTGGAQDIWNPGP